GGAGNDNASGGAGADTFVFRPGDGRLRIEDFGHGPDRLDLSGFGLADFAALEAAAHQQGHRLVIDLGADRLVLAHVTLADLAPGDVLL
ncbi:MAG: hypothetical protein D6801_07270, partial [Alphaproteobacteria bacterium]